MTLQRHRVQEVQEPLTRQEKFQIQLVDGTVGRKSSLFCDMVELGRLKFIGPRSDDLKRSLQLIRQIGVAIWFVHLFNVT